MGSGVHGPRSQRKELSWSLTRSGSAHDLNHCVLGLVIEKEAMNCLGEGCGWGRLSKKVILEKALEE